MTQVVWLGPVHYVWCPFLRMTSNLLWPLLKFVFQRLLKQNEDGSLASRPSHHTLIPFQIQWRLKMGSLPPEACLLTLNDVQPIKFTEIFMFSWESWLVSTLSYPEWPESRGGSMVWKAHFKCLNIYLNERFKIHGNSCSLNTYCMPHAVHSSSSNTRSWYQYLYFTDENTKTLGY